MSTLNYASIVAAIVIAYGLIYHIFGVTPARCYGRKLKTRISPAWARVTYVLMAIAIGVLLWSFMESVVVTWSGAPAVALGCLIAILSWTFLAVQFIRMLPRSVDSFKGWEHAQFLGAQCAVMFQTLGCLILAAGAILPFTV